MSEYLARLFSREGEEEGDGEAAYGRDAELFLDDLDMLLMRRDDGEGQGDENNNDDHEDEDEDHQQARTGRNLTLSSRATSPQTTPTLVVTYQPQLTQPLWADLEAVEKDGHLEPLLVPAEDGTVVVVDVGIVDAGAGDGVDVFSWSWWLTTVYYTVSLSLLGLLVLAYSLLFASITLNGCWFS